MTHHKKRHHKAHKYLTAFLAFGSFFLITVVVLVSVFNLQTVREFLSRASGQPANITVDVSQIGEPISKPWRNLAQGGEDHNWDMTPIIPKVRELEPEYIRLDHIYTFYDIVKKENGQLSFDFSKLDKILDQIEATGAKPYIALSYMPPAISSGDIISAPNDWNEWQLTIRRTIEHISGTRGTADVYYEVWNEPDLFGDWKTYGDKNYLTMYSYSARGAAQAQNVQPFKFGGPGITALYKNWFTRMADFTTQNNLRYDFFSWHRYNMNADQFTKDYAEVKEWQAQYPQLANLELHITEWGHDSKNHPGYDSTLGAAHTAAISLEMVGNIDRGFVFEIEDGKDPAGQERWGRWGLLTHQSFGANPKPRYQALRFLNQLDGLQLFSSGNGSWVKAVATQNGTTTQLMLANYDSAFRNSEAVPVTILNAPPGEYTMRQTFFGGQTTTNTVVFDSAVFQTTIQMAPNTIALVEFTPNFDVTQAVPLPQITPEPVPERNTGFGRILNTIGQ